MSFEKDPEQNETKHLLQFADIGRKRVLEIGCGEGRLTWRYAAKPAMTIGIDPDRDALRVATIDRPSDLKKRVHFSNTRAEWLPFPKETFDTAILAWSF
jgi:ubiquinone/menaquinone biosynthesis C-methylase UbiE